MTRLFAFLLLLPLSSLTVQAKEWTVQMLNYSGNESMVFEPSMIHAEIGDTVVFVPSHSGHYAQAYVTPQGASKWKTKLDEQATIELKEEGVHVYYCPPHLMMGMVGMIQVGQALNQEDVEKKMANIKAKAHLNPKRIDQLVTQITSH